MPFILKEGMDVRFLDKESLACFLTMASSWLIVGYSINDAEKKLEACRREERYLQDGDGLRYITALGVSGGFFFFLVYTFFSYALSWSAPPFGFFPVFLLFLAMGAGLGYVFYAGAKNRRLVYRDSQNSLEYNHFGVLMTMLDSLRQGRAKS
jgi:hypothetical protein